MKSYLLCSVLASCLLFTGCADSPSSAPVLVPTLQAGDGVAPRKVDPFLDLPGERELVTKGSNVQLGAHVEEVLFAGRLVDAKGQGVSLSVRLFVPPRGLGDLPFGTAFMEAAGGAGNIPPGMRSLVDWDPQDLMNVPGPGFILGIAQADKEGHFEFRGQVDAARVRLAIDSNQYMLTTEKGSYQQPDPWVQVGTTDGLFSVKRGARFHFGLNGNDPGQASAVRLRVSASGSDYSIYDGAAADGWSPVLPTGNYQFELFFRATDPNDNSNREQLYAGTVTLVEGSDVELGSLSLDRVLFRYDLVVRFGGERFLYELDLNSIEESAGFRASVYGKPGHFTSHGEDRWTVYALHAQHEVHVHRRHGTAPMSPLSGAMVFRLHQEPGEIELLVN